MRPISTTTALAACAFLHFTASRCTGKERDSESGLDYFGARYYASTTGRFLSPDWSAKEEPVPYAKLDNPQTLNLYQYMRNNPLGGVDPDGHCCEDVMDAAGAGSIAFPEAAPVIIGVAGGIVLGNAIWDNREAIGEFMSNAGGGGPQYGDFSRQLSISNEQGGEPPQLKAGKDAHNAEEVRPGEKKEVPTASGKGRIDRYDADKGHIREIKPDNARGRRAGQKQLDRYKADQEQATNKPHTTELTTYPPKNQQQP